MPRQRKTEPEYPLTKVDDVLRYALVRYYGLHRNRAHALEFIFCVNGNGYDWHNGCLVDVVSKRQPRLTPAVWAEAAEESRVTELRNAYYQAQDDLWRKQGYAPLWPLYLEPLMPKDEAELEQRLHDLTYHRTYVYPLYKASWGGSHILCVPDDVRPDWLAAAREVLALILALDPADGYYEGAGEHRHLVRTNAPDIALAQEAQLDLDRRFPRGKE